MVVIRNFSSLNRNYVKQQGNHTTNSHSIVTDFHKIIQELARRSVRSGNVILPRLPTRFFIVYMEKKWNNRKSTATQTQDSVQQEYTRQH